MESELGVYRKQVYSWIDEDGGQNNVEYDLDLVESDDMPPIEFLDSPTVLIWLRTGY